MKPAHLIVEDAVAIRGILDLFAESETIRAREVAMTQQISDDAARRLMKLLEKAGIVEHPTVTQESLSEYLKKCLHQLATHCCSEARRDPKRRRPGEGTSMSKRLGAKGPKGREPPAEFEPYSIGPGGGGCMQDFLQSGGRHGQRGG